MARGWESKSVEEQQSEAISSKDKSLKALTPEEANRKRLIDGLELKRKAVLQQMQAAKNPQHRKMLEGALADLDGKLAKLR
ncbi:MAG TPA: hypothetical protein VFA74_16955 [Terriglobales bacterium]|nr:hypothetical protein [Terriglobales bacterium]